MNSSQTEIRESVERIQQVRQEAVFAEESPWLVHHLTDMISMAVEGEPNARLAVEITNRIAEA